jgi:phosphoenolpyruvate carboxykinase (GTP)
LWPGFGENCRVLKWICERVDGAGKARSTPIGYVPTHDGLDIDGLDIEQDTLHKLLHVDNKQWLDEIPAIREYYAMFGERIPPRLKECIDGLEARLLAATAAPTGELPFC